MNHRLIRFSLGTALFTALDQLTKYLAVRFLKNAPDIILIPGVFQLSYLQNQGAAWGMFAGMRWIFLVLTLLVLAGIILVVRRLPSDNKVYLPFFALCMLLAAGALGNALDRLFRGYVVDFFYFSLINFPVFNVADCFVCVSLFLLVILYRNEDFSWMKSK